MKFRRKAFRVMFVMIVVIGLYPITVLANHYINIREASIHKSLQSQRFGLTQLSNDKHVLNNYAMRLSHDTQLNDAVKKSSDKNGLWQTPAQQVRIQFADGINHVVEHDNDVTSAVLDWLDNRNAKSGGSTKVQKIWLNASVKSVPRAVDLISSIKDMARPYPVRVHGCSYERSRSALEGVFYIKAQCLLVLETWVLPFVKFHGKQPVYDAPSNQRIPNKRTRVAGFNEWNIFNTERLAENTLEVESLNSTKTQVADKSSPTEYRESKAIINGPAGRLVIHAFSE